MNNKPKGLGQSIKIVKQLDDILEVLNNRNPNKYFPNLFVSRTKTMIKKLTEEIILNDKKFIKKIINKFLDVTINYSIEHGNHLSEKIIPDFLNDSKIWGWIVHYIYNDGRG